MKNLQLLQQNNQKIVDSEEQRRLLKLISFEQEALAQGFKTIAGIDEAGRGPLAGPVVAAACIIPPGLFFNQINDSKKLSKDLRETLYKELTSNPNIVFSLGIMCQNVIDRVNIYQATIMAMLQAISELKTTPDYLLVDGLKLPHPMIPSLKIIKGDALSQSIAAASIIAKVTRDRMMEEFDLQWPEYGFKQHKGYGTAKHLAAIEMHGPCLLHRQSFEPIKTRFVQKKANEYEVFCS